MTTRSGAPGARHATSGRGTRRSGYPVSGYNVTNAGEYSKSRGPGDAEDARRIIPPFFNERESNRDSIHAEKI